MLQSFFTTKDYSTCSKVRLTLTFSLSSQAFKRQFQKQKQRKILRFSGSTMHMWSACVWLSKFYFVLEEYKHFSTTNTKWSEFSTKIFLKFEYLFHVLLERYIAINYLRISERHFKQYITTLSIRSRWRFFLLCSLDVVSFWNWLLNFLICSDSDIP